MPNAAIRLTLLVLAELFAGCASRRYDDIEKCSYLRPYVHQLKTEASQADLVSIRDMSKSELILLLHGYGTGIRNRWIHGDRDHELVRFFHDHGVDDPEAMSMFIIYALWDDLNSNLTPEERASIQAKRKTVERKRSVYEKLEAEGRQQLSKTQQEFEHCYQKYGLPSKNPQNHDPFFHLLIDKTGHVRQIDFFEGADPQLKQCLTPIIQRFRFAPFTEDEVVTLYILEFPNCRIAERDTLHRP